MIIGPTAGGKTALGVEVALRLREAGAPGEVISADSVQVYRGLDVGSGKPTAAERRGVPHHLIDEADPRERFTVSDWLERAERAIGEVRGRGGTPVVVGGTHLYVKALLEGLFEGPGAEPEIRAELERLDDAALRAELERVDPEAAVRIHPNDRRRTVRALEVHRATGRPISAWQREWDRGFRADAVVVALLWRAPALNRRINARVKAMMEAGLLEEVRALHEAGALGAQAREALGYKQLLAHLEGRCSLEEAVERIKIETRRFAKNQRTWLRRLVGRATPPSGEAASDDGGPVLLDGSALDPSAAAQNIVDKVLTDR